MGSGGGVRGNMSQQMLNEEKQGAVNMGFHVHKSYHHMLPFALLFHLLIHLCSCFNLGRAPLTT